MLFKNRADAGQALAEKLAKLNSLFIDEAPLVLALPRGGVPVAFEVARELGAQLDVLIVRKIGAPGQSELALGAIASGGVTAWNNDIIQALGISQERIQRVVEHEQQELTRRERAYRGYRPQPRVQDRTVLLIDDGLATGASMLAAIRAVHAQHPKKLIVAVPVASNEACAAISQHVDEIVCLNKPSPFFGVGTWYDDFTQTTDQQVHDLLALAFDQTENSNQSPDQEIFPDY